MKQIIFYNNFHYGDIYLNLPFLLYISKQLKCKVIFLVNIITDIIDDNNILLYNNNNKEYIDIHNKYDLHNNNDKIFIEDFDTILINNWIKPYWIYYPEKNYKLNIDGYIKIYNDIIYNKLNVDNNNNILEYIYTIPYNITNFLNNNNIILILNGQVCSGQLPQFSMDYLINILSTKYTIITSHKTNVANIVSFEELYPFSNNKTNINKIASFAKYCKYIIGKECGLFEWCLNKDTINIKNIVISHNINYIPVSHIFNTKVIQYSNNMFNEIINYIN